MACGVHLGILLICLVQAEHVGCSWVTHAKSSQKQNGNKYVGLSQQDSGLRRLTTSYPQNQFRQVSAQRHSFNIKPLVSSGYSQGLSSSPFTQTASQPAQSGYSSVRFVQTSSLSKPNWQPAKPNQVTAPKEPRKQFFGLSPAIASGTSLSKYKPKPKGLPVVSNKGTWPVQQGALHTSKYLSSSSITVQTPSKGKPSSYLLAAQKAPSAAETPVLYRQTSYSPLKSSIPSSVAVLKPQRKPVQMQTSATGPARRVTSRHGSKPSEPSFSTPHHGKSRSDASQTEAGNPFRSKLLTGQGRHKPTSTSSLTSNGVSYSQSLPGATKRNARVGFWPISPQVPISQGLSYKPSYTSSEQISSSTGSLQAPWNSRNLAQGAHNFPASGSTREGTSGQRFAPTETHSIPGRFGGFAIRRLRGPVDKKEVSVRKPHQAYTAPSQQSDTSKPHVQRVHPASKWKRVRGR